MNVQIKKPFYTERFDIVEELEASYEQIKEEFLQIVSADHYCNWPEKFFYNDGWNVFGLRFMYKDMEEAHTLCPFLSSFIRKHDKLIATAGFSILNPGTIIYPHEGYSDQLLRCHLGIEVPEGDCFLLVDSIEKRWKEGEAFIFDDTFEHQTWNITEEKRIIMLLDLDKEILLNEVAV